MTEPTPTPANRSSAPAYDEGQIDLRAALVAVVRRWTLIRDFVILAAVAAAVYAALIPATYQARSGVVLSKTRTQVNFDPKIKTVSADDFAVGQIDQTTRRATLVGLVQNPAIAQMVIKEIGPQLPIQLQNPDQLTRQIDGSIGRTAGDLIEIRMTWSDPTVAQSVVDSWSRNYEKYVNGIYAAGYSPRASLDQERASAKAQYDRALADYLQITGSSRIQDLTRQVDDHKQSIAVFQERMNAEKDGLAALYSTRLQLQQLLEDTRTLRDQVAQPGSSPSSNALAITLLKARIAMPATATRDFSPGAPSQQPAAAPVPTPDGSQTAPAALPAQREQPRQQLQPQMPNITIQAAIQPGGETAAAQLADLDALVKAVQDRITQVDASIEQRSADVQRANPSQASIDRLQKEELALEASLAKEQAALQEATRARDLAWSTYSSLASAVDESTIAQKVGGTEVIYAVPASAEPSTTLSRRLAPVAIAVVAAIAIALIAVAILEAVTPERPTPHIRWTGWLRRGRAEKP